jgi:hypothetical protein
MAGLDVLGGAPKGTGGVVEENLLLLSCHQAEEIAWLLPVIVVHTVVPMGGVALDR